MHRPRRLVPCRRAHRSVRVVDGDLTPRRRYSPLGPETASVYEHCLARVQNMRDLFPDFYQQHIAWRQLTPRALYAAVSAFLALVNARLFELEDCYSIEIPLDPLRALAYTEDDEIAHQGPLLNLEEALAWLVQPHAQLYGIGIEGILENEEPQSVLTLALWKLCQHTDWSIGVDVNIVIGYSYLPETQAEQVRKLHPLSAEVSMDRLCAAIGQSGLAKGADQLIRYAFARTGNPMADVTNYEVDVVYGGDLDDDWDDAPGIAETAAAARKLVEHYGQWAALISANPIRELKRLEKALHDAARATVAPKGEAPPRALIDILAEHNPAFAEVTA